MGDRSLFPIPIGSLAVLRGASWFLDLGLKVRLGFRVKGSRVQGLGFTGLRVHGLGFRVEG